MEPLVLIMNALMTVFFGSLPLVLLSLPAAVTDKCIELETHLSDLIMPCDLVVKTKGRRYVVSYELGKFLSAL